MVLFVDRSWLASIEKLLCLVLNLPICGWSKEHPRSWAFWPWRWRQYVLQNIGQLHGFTAYKGVILHLTEAWVIENYCLISRNICKAAHELCTKFSFSCRMLSLECPPVSLFKVHVIWNIIVNLKALCFFPLVPQLLEMFLLTKVMYTHTHTKLGRHCCNQFCCTTKYCVCQSDAFVIYKASKEQLFQEIDYISSQK
jgi:hypothetical protein